MVVLKRGELNVATVTKRELPTCKTFLEATDTGIGWCGVNKRSVFCNAVSALHTTKL